MGDYNPNKNFVDKVRLCSPGFWFSSVSLKYGLSKFLTPTEQRHPTRGFYSFDCPRIRVSIFPVLPTFRLRLPSLPSGSDDESGPLWRGRFHFSPPVSKGLRDLEDKGFFVMYVSFTPKP